MTEQQVIHENGRFWVMREYFKGRPVCKVMESKSTHSVVRDTFDLGPASLPRAVDTCDLRAAQDRK